MKKPEPRIGVFCRCGAQWWGRFAVNNPVIEAHGNRCGAPIAEVTFVALGFSAKRPYRWRRQDEKREATNANR